MQTVEDESGRRYLLVKRSRESSRVCDPATGEERYIENDRLDHVEGASPLETAAGAIPPAVRRVLVGAPNERALGLLLDLDARGPRSVRGMLDAYDLCESDLHGLLAELRLAGLIEAADVAGERGYATSDAAMAGLAALQSAGTE